MGRKYKPLGFKSYGSIGHLSKSRMGPSESKVPQGQEIIATQKLRDKKDIVIVQEKLDGSNVGVALKDGKIYALGRAGYEAKTSPYPMHHAFHDWVYENEERFRSILKNGQRVCGEWLLQPHGTIYELNHEPFVAFDIFDAENMRFNFDAFQKTLDNKFVTPYLVSLGPPVSVEHALESLGEFGRHGATEAIEGAVWRVERNGQVDFLCKYVRPDKIDGKYLKPRS